MIAKTKSKTKPAGPALLPACTCIRMSTDDQQSSPAQQRAAMPKLAAEHGYEIVKEYIDEGISGAESKKRPQFMQMMADAAAGKFKAILAWDQDRFSRFDAMEANHYWHILRRAGVKIITVAQGELKWDDLGGWLTASISQHGKNQYLVDLSRNVCRGLHHSAQRNQTVFHAPLGYDRVYFNEKGQEVQRVPYGEKFRKPKSWTCKPAISEGDAPEVIRWIFETFTATDCSAQSLAVALNRRGRKSPSGKLWSHDTIADALTNPFYTGTYTFGRFCCGKFHSSDAGGGVVKSKSRSRRIKREPLIVVENNHPAIVSKKTFELAQAKLLERSVDRRAPTTRSYPLSGLMRCGHCQSPMAGYTSRSYKGQRYYVCSDAHEGLCQHRRLNANRIEGQVVALAQELFLSPGVESELRVVLARQFAGRATAAPSKVKALRDQIAKLEKQIQRGAKNLMLAEPEDVPEAKRVLAEWRQEKTALESTLKGLDASGKRRGSSVDELVTAAMSEHRRIHERLQHADPAISRHAFRALFHSLTLTWHPRKAGRRNYRPAKLVVEAKTDMSFLGDSARAAPTPATCRQIRPRPTGVPERGVGPPSACANSADEARATTP